MPITSGLSFYETSDFPSPTSSTFSSITYGFDTLSDDDISVVGINASGVRILLVKDTDFTLNLLTKTITPTTASWSVLTKIVSNVSTRIRVYRITSVLPTIDFKAGAVLNESDLDSAYKQGLFAAQEMTEDAADTSAGGQSVTESAIENGAVTANKLASDAVTQTKILNNAVSSAKIQTNAITADKILNGSVGSTKLASSCVTSLKINDGAVTNAKIAAHSIGYLEIDNDDAAIVKDSIETSLASSPVTPDVLKYSPFSPKCYGSVSYNQTATQVVHHSYNVNTTTTTAAGVTNNNRIIYFDTPMLDTNYTVVASLGSSVMPSAITTGSAGVLNKTVSSFELRLYHNPLPGAYVDFVVFGSKLDES